MTLSYSVGLTGGSAIAYLLDSWLGPMVDPCSPLNLTTILPHNQTMESIVTHELTTLMNTTTLSTTTLLPSTVTTLSSTTTLTSTLSTTLSSTIMATTLESLTSAFTTVTTYVASSVMGNNTMLQSLFETSTEALS